MKRFLMALLCITICGIGGFAFELEQIEVEACIEKNAVQATISQAANKYKSGLLDIDEDYDDKAVSKLRERICQSWDNLDGIIDVSDLGFYNGDEQMLVDIYVDLAMGNPEYFYVDLYSNECLGIVTSGRGVVSLTPSYIYDKAYIKETMSAIEDASLEILDLVDDDMTAFEKIMTVHDYMVLNYEYDISVFDGNEEVVRDIRMMLTKKGVCMGYSYSFKYIMDKLSIGCTFVESEEMAHEWNLVQIDDEWYHIDLTFDDSLYNDKDMFAQVSHEFALLSTNEILRKGHTGFEDSIDDYEVDSCEYDDAEWRNDSIASVVTLFGVHYYVAGNDLVDENGRVIFGNLSGKDGNWDLGQGGYLPNKVFTGIASYNGLLYFNTDKAIYYYNPQDASIELFLEKEGICGLYVENSMLRYGKLDLAPDRANSFVEDGFLYVGGQGALDEVLNYLVNGTDKMSVLEKKRANFYKDDDKNGNPVINIKDFIKLAQMVKESNR